MGASWEQFAGAGDPLQANSGDLLPGANMPEVSPHTSARCAQPTVSPACPQATATPQHGMAQHSGALLKAASPSEHPPPDQPMLLAEP